jgi:hypothetical protein
MINQILSDFGFGVNIFLVTIKSRFCKYSHLPVRKSWF